MADCGETVGEELGQVLDGVVMYSLRCECSCDVIDYSMPDVHMVVSQLGSAASKDDESSSRMLVSGGSGKSPQ